MNNVKFCFLFILINFISLSTYADQNGIMSTFGDNSFPEFNGAMDTYFNENFSDQGEFNGIRTEIEPQSKIFATGLNGIMDVLDPHSDSTIGHKIIVKKIDTPPVQLQLFYPVNGYLVESNNTSSLNIYLKAIQNNQVKSIVISGFADPTGNIDYNQKLSKKRADSVAKWLINHGVASSKINIIGAGIDSEKEDFQQARRVDIVIYSK